MDNKIEKGQKYSVAGTDSGFEVVDTLDGGGLRVKWLDTTNVVELQGAQVTEYIASGQLKLIDPNAPIVPMPAATTELTAAAAAATADTTATEKKEGDEPETSGRLRVKRVVRHVPNAAYVAAMKKALDMSDMEFATLMAPKTKEA